MTPQKIGRDLVVKRDILWAALKVQSLVELAPENITCLDQETYVDGIRAQGVQTFSGNPKVRRWTDFYLDITRYKLIKFSYQRIH